ncbi:MAG: hypothetical protein F6K09_32685, partial [Merismopedia sp. SIO2A8]|nr:hypothetical protein [Merismopedia sp. SIO2A8]
LENEGTTFTVKLPIVEPNDETGTEDDVPDANSKPEKGKSSDSARSPDQSQAILHDGSNGNSHDQALKLPGERGLDLKHDDFRYPSTNEGIQGDESQDNASKNGTLSSDPSQNVTM